jgi:hypothetical protein
VDVTKPYAEQDSFLEIELAARAARAHQTCGGRALNDDVMDTLFTQATMPAARTFPYLAAPNPDPPKPPEHL